MIYKHINTSTITASLLGNTEMIQTFLELYKTQTPIDLQLLKDAVQSKNHVDIAKSAHHIKPTMAYIGAENLRDELQTLEDLGKKMGDFSNIEAHFTVVENALNELYLEIEDYLQKY